jgi:hypothetical protein
MVHHGRFQSFGLLGIEPASSELHHIRPFLPRSPFPNAIGECHWRIPLANAIV